ncbi:hypothetical protein D3C80_568570 [compost metagenome]
MGAVQPGLGLDPELLLEGTHEGIEKIVTAGLGLEYFFPYQGVDYGVKQNGAHPGLAKLLIDASPHLACLFQSLHEGNGDLFEDQRKLAQHGMAEHLGGDGGAIGYIEYGVHSGLLWCAPGGLRALSISRNHISFVNRSAIPKL